MAVERGQPATTAAAAGADCGAQVHGKLAATTEREGSVWAAAAAMGAVGDFFSFFHTFLK